MNTKPASAGLYASFLIWDGVRFRGRDDLLVAQVCNLSALRSAATEDWPHCWFATGRTPNAGQTHLNFGKYCSIEKSNHRVPEAQMRIAPRFTAGWQIQCDEFRKSG